MRAGPKLGQVRPMRRIVGRIKIDGDQPGAMVQPRDMALDHTLGQRCAHVIKLARPRRHFQSTTASAARPYRARNRLSVQQHLAHRIGSQTRPVVGVRITAADGERGLREKIMQRMANLARLPRIAQTACHTGDQSVTLLGCLQQHRATNGTALPLVELQYHRLGENLWKQQTPCRDRISHAKAFFVP